MIAGTKGDFETKAVIPLEAMIEMYNKVPSSKVMMRRKDTDHGGMLYSTDGYVTAWLMWQLQDCLLYTSHIMEKIPKYITKSFPIDSEKLSRILELSESYFSP